VNSSRDFALLRDLHQMPVGISETCDEIGIWPVANSVRQLIRVAAPPLDFEVAPVLWDVDPDNV
jgi:hypothetical protein